MALRNIMNCQTDDILQKVIGLQLFYYVIMGLLWEFAGLCIGY